MRYQHFIEFKELCRMHLFRRLVMLTLVALVFGVAQEARAQGPMGRSFGVGVSLGNPLSFTGKYHLSQNEAIDFHVGAFQAYGNYYYRRSVFLGADYLFTVWNFLENSSVSIPFYAGPGLGLLIGTTDCHRDRRRRNWCDDRFGFGFGPRLPIGVGVEFQKAPFELGLEMSPSMMILLRDNPYGDEVGVDFTILNFAFIARFYFE